MDVSLIVNSDTDPELMGFSLELDGWNERGINISVIFENPLYVSKGIHKDHLLCKLKFNKLFYSSETLRLDRIYIQKPLKR